MESYTVRYRANSFCIFHVFLDLAVIIDLEGVPFTSIDLRMIFSLATQSPDVVGHDSSMQNHVI